MKDEIDKKVLEAFRKIDETIDVSAPSPQTISLLIKEKHEAHIKSVKRELCLFLLIAVVIISLLLLLLTNAPLIYGFIQVVGIIGVTFYGLYKARKRNREDLYI